MQIQAHLLAPASDNVWPLDDGKKGARSAALSLARGSRSPEENIALANERARLSRERSRAMASHLHRRLQETKKGTRPRIVVLSVGSHHLVEIARELERRGGVSVLGLLPHRFVDVLDPLVKMPQ